jgi:TolB-like protein/class 3 adenylate cyclase/Flp pilus assembly protein TadD
MSTDVEIKERRLATILAADIVGYSRLMDADEEGTYTAMRAVRSGIIDPTIDKHHGRIVKHTGDGFLAEFPTVMAAVQFSMQLQEQMGAFVDDTPTEQRIRFRIGINIGDIIADADGDIFGDGVNVAARLESLGIPGGICISEPVYQTVHKKLDVGFDDLGDQSVKNISTPVRAYDIRWPGEGGTPEDRVLERPSRRNRFLVTAVALALALGFIAFDKMGPEQPVTDLKPSIAVLPFVNMSDDESNEYFSEGLSEELLNLLAKIPELHVVARTSSFSFKGQDLEITEIGKRLNATHILEGSVRKSGNQVRITSQLIQAKDGFHLWSKTHDRTLDDIFAIQDEISASVVEELKLSLLGEIPTVEQTAPAAYAYLLQARHLSREGEFDRAIALYQQALAIDPEYAAAWNEIANVHVTQAQHGLTTAEEGYQTAREMAGRALQINPDFAPAYATLGYIAIFYDGDLKLAAQQLKKALDLEPANISILRDVAVLSRNLGRLEESVAVFEYIVARDPVNDASYSNLSYAYTFVGRADDALAAYHTALQQGMNPDYPGTKFFYGLTALSKNEPEEALAALQEESYEVLKMIGLPMAYHALGRTAESDAAVNNLIEMYEQDAPYNIAYIWAFRGEADQAFTWLEKAKLYNDGGIADAPVEPLFANIHDDPRWIPFLESIGKSPQQLAAIEFSVQLPDQ